jgi:uncharacterized damage-inducible protein DinB
MNLRPEENEYAPYYSSYINLIPAGNIVDILKEQLEKTVTTLNILREEQSLFRYSSDKWSIKEVLGHIADTERIMSYRLLCIARGESTALPGFNENLYVSSARFDQIPLRDLIDNFIAVRQSTLQLIKGLDELAWSRRGIANGVEVTVRAIAYIIAGHELHHRNIIQERYITSSQFPS